MNFMTGDSFRRFVDTSILVYAHDEDAGEKQRQARELVIELWESGNGCLSVQVLQEFFVTVTRTVRSPLDSDEALQVIEDYARWDVHIATPADVLDAIAIHRRYEISLWDAMILNSASKLGCRTVYSEDLNASQRYGEVRVVNPFV